VVAVAMLDGRRRAATIAIGAIACAIASWAAIGFADISQYPRLLTDLSAIEAHNSFSTTGMAYALGLPLELGSLLGVALGAVAGALSFHEARRRHRDSAFTYGVLAALLLSPIVWMHYLTLLPIAIAARFPRFGAIWLVPLTLWAYQLQAPAGNPFALLLFWGCVLTIVVAVVQDETGGHLVTRMRDLARTAVDLRSWTRSRGASMVER
jgi:Glycosyltransferase family 87